MPVGKDFFPHQEDKSCDTDMRCDGGRCPRNKYENTFTVSGKRETGCTRVLNL